MMSDQTTGLVILGAVVIFAVVAVVLVIRGRKPRYPEGIRADTKPNGLHVVMVCEPGECSKYTHKQTLADHCHKAVMATVEAWEAKGLPGDVRGKLDGVCCLFLSDETYDQPVPGSDWAEAWVKGTAAYLAQVPQATGSGPPMPVIRSRYIGDVIETGEPIIHECLHACCQAGGLGYRDHDDPRVWAMHRSGCVQADAWELFTADAKNDSE